MALSDLTDPQAVLSAMSECDKLGRDRFLNKYSFGEARTYFLEYDGRRYDSKAIAGVAHGIQFDRPLAASEFSGGDATVAAKLTDLGFVVTRPSQDWQTALGTVMTKSDIKRLYGGSIYGGIEPSKTTANVMLYTDPSVGLGHGYKYDEHDAREVGVFYYTGEGQLGDQTITHGNRAIVDHVQSGRVLRLFEAIDGKQRPGGKLQCYVGAYYIDPTAPYEFRSAPDSTGTLRQVVVFRLLRDEVVGYPDRPRFEIRDSPIPRRAAPQSPPAAVCAVHHLVIPINGECDFCA